MLRYFELSTEEYSKRTRCLSKYTRHIFDLDFFKELFDYLSRVTPNHIGYKQGDAYDKIVFYEQKYNTVLFYLKSNSVYYLYAFPEQFTLDKESFKQCINIFEDLDLDWVL